LSLGAFVFPFYAAHCQQFKRCEVLFPGYAPLTPPLLVKLKLPSSCKWDERSAGRRSSAFFYRDRVKNGQLLFHVVASAGRADGTVDFVIVKTDLFCERFQATAAMEKI